jgi:hypothetical protein
MIGRTLDKDRLGLSVIDERKFIILKFGETLRLSNPGVLNRVNE